MSRLVVAMLNMSKIESGDFEMKPKPYNLSDQIIHILLTFEQKIEKKNIEIRGLENLEPHHITADTDMIYQVIYNLFDNAVKFTNDGGYIEINVSDVGDNVQVSIKTAVRVLTLQSFLVCLKDSIRWTNHAHLIQRVQDLDFI